MGRQGELGGKDMVTDLGRTRPELASLLGVEFRNAASRRVKNIEGDLPLRTSEGSWKPFLRNTRPRDTDIGAQWPYIYAYTCT